MSENKDSNTLLELLSQAGPGSAVKALLTLRKISQTELSMKLGIAPSELSRVISGKRKTPHIRKAIAAELGLAVETLFGGIDEQEKASEPVLTDHAPNLFKAAASTTP